MRISRRRNFAGVDFSGAKLDSATCPARRSTTRILPAPRGSAPRAVSTTTEGKELAIFD